MVQGVVVLLHGRGGRKEDLLPVAERFVAAGFRCLVPDLPAHGASPLSGVAYGASEFERVLSRRLLNDARRRFGFPEEPAALWGLSMGGAFAVRAASESPLLWKALIVVSTFDALEEVLAAQTARYVGLLGPVVARAVDHLGVPHDAPRLAAIRPAGWASQVTVPTLVVHGDQDTLIPMAHGRQLYEGLASPERRWVTVAGGGHHGILATPAPLYAEMSAWFLRWLRIPITGGETRTIDRGVSLPVGIGHVM
jgi:pimeloyl-ACP methyl ester carboxylesterase